MKPKQSLLSEIDYQADHCRRQDFLLLKFHDLPSRKRGCGNEGGVCARASRGRRAEGSATRPEGLPPGHPITAAACVGSVRDRPTDRLDRCWAWSVCQCGKGFQWVGAIRDPFTPEYQNCIIAFWNE
ncbi:unnamed protein product [Sphagnum jensenii]|uniref:Uncharacterized protein n=1 Tax=Sphagnum jensenii TaxID=128206 RepID=A0ABP1BR56_9BRYO